MKKAVMALAAAAMMFSLNARPVHAGGATCEKTIVENAVSIDGFETLVAAVKAGGLVETLSGKGPFTVFAPTDAAFAKLPAGTLEDLLKPENKDKLVAILTYHVVPGAVMAKDVVKLTEAKTVQGSKVKIKVDGVIHVIDTVILPKH